MNTKPVPMSRTDHYTGVALSTSITMTLSVPSDCIFMLQKVVVSGDDKNTPSMLIEINNNPHVFKKSDALTPAIEYDFPSGFEVAGGSKISIVGTSSASGTTANFYITVYYQKIRT